MHSGLDIGNVYNNDTNLCLSLAIIGIIICNRFSHYFWEFPGLQCGYLTMELVAKMMDLCKKVLMTPVLLEPWFGLTDLIALSIEILIPTLSWKPFMTCNLSLLGLCCGCIYLFFL